MSYFVVAIHPQRGIPMPIMDGSDENEEKIKLYKTFSEAKAMAEEHVLCKAGGYKIIKWEFCGA